MIHSVDFLLFIKLVTASTDNILPVAVRQISTTTLPEFLIDFTSTDCHRERIDRIIAYWITRCMKSSNEEEEEDEKNVMFIES
jgi:hypothetical protein